MKKDYKDKVTLPHFFADTCWFALTKRLDDANFLKLVETRERHTKIPKGTYVDVNTGNIVSKLPEKGSIVVFY